MGSTDDLITEIEKRGVYVYSFVIVG